MSESSRRICILGGGFGGLYTALRLSELPWEPSCKPEIILIDRRDRFLFSPLLYELISGELQTWEIAPPFVELLENTGVTFKQARAIDINFEERQIHLAEQSPLSYDQLVLGIGGKTPFKGIPGVADHALPFRTLEDAYSLNERLRALECSDRDKIRVAIVGGGYSGVELACKVADRLGERGRLRIIDRGTEILHDSPEFNRETAQKALEERGVWLDLETTVDSLEADSISLKYKEQVDEIPVDIVLWTVGTQAPDLIQSFPLKRDRAELLITTPTLQLIDRPEIFAVGDVASCQDATGQKVPATAQVAIQQADYCAWNLWASLTNRPLLPFRYQPLGEMMALGIENATVSGLGVKLEGRAAHLARRLAYLYRLPTLKHQLTVGLNWMAQPLRELLSP
ncbi:NAD(P)/FAD-dependent oxidoreductase [Lusitaniella coriacea LEGE 07157]|uniref:demethylphylloquinone reductase n=1 Tax=Lusitaniella coriacea LEGE 07157 TaxID=945747 RepID=A0A8J7DTX6_9CYAN|nr:NAD(P)/FAD-dependent oxidoreductase [Lusitaniella coriacea]MBE9114456.1 NAD(P)/FAD-dependent oxidoreductase [Lusitaniella coriacea LEGE 07157]